MQLTRAILLACGSPTSTQPPHPWYLPGLDQDPWGQPPDWLGPRCGCADKSRSWELHPFCLFTCQHVRRIRRLKLLWWSEPAWPATSTLPLLSRETEHRVGGEAFSRGTLQFYWNTSTAVKSSCWVISRLVLPITVSIKTQQNSRM